MTDDLAAWLLERIAEDEAAARASLAASEPDEPWGYDHLPGDGPHIARWDPARVLAECEAKRCIVEWAQSTVDAGGRNFSDGYACALEDCVQVLALPYAERPGYRGEWAP